MGYMCAAADSEGLPVTSPRGMFDGFEGYRTASKDQQRDALRSAMVVVDTSVLLNLYRYTATTRDDLLKVLDRLGGRLWVPNQVMREFWRNRLSALGNHGSVAQQTRGSLDKQRRGTTDVVGRWASAIGLDGSEMKGLQGQVDTLYLSLSEAITRLQPADVGASGQTHEDAVLARLEPLLDGRVGPALPEEERARNITEGARRVRDKIPPGYMDAEKAEVNREEGAAGDYLVWVESMHEAARRTQDLIVVTSDEKEDWWLRHRGDLLGPRVELVAEFRAHCGRQLHLMTPSALLAQASALDVEVRPSSLENAARVDARREDGSEWTKEAVFELLRRLESRAGSRPRSSARPPPTAALWTATPCTRSAAMPTTGCCAGSPARPLESPVICRRRTCCPRASPPCSLPSTPGSELLALKSRGRLCQSSTRSRRQTDCALVRVQQSGHRRVRRVGVWCLSAPLPSVEIVDDSFDN